MKYSVKIISVPCDSEEQIMAVQRKLNQWKTTELLKKYEIHTTSTHIVFNVCIEKEV